MELEPRALHLDHLCCIEISGDDAETFLQSQFTNDLDKLQPGQQQPGAYCNPKGRALCLFRMLRTEDRWLMILPGELSDSIIKRLTLYRMRAKVSIELRESARILGVIHPRQVIDDIGAVEQGWQLDDHRLMVVTDNESNGWTGGELETEQDTGIWRLSEIVSGIPQVYLATTEQFIPQHINLDLIGGVSFGKGCYPGQEIVARLRYLGKLKQRMIAVAASGPLDCQVGDPVYSEGRGTRKAGQVVEAVEFDAMHYALLSLSADAISEGEIRIGSVDGPVARRLTLPYEITV